MSSVDGMRHTMMPTSDPGGGGSPENARVAFRSILTNLKSPITVRTNDIKSNGTSPKPSPSTIPSSNNADHRSNEELAKKNLEQNIKKLKKIKKTLRKFDYIYDKYEEAMRKCSEDYGPKYVDWLSISKTDETYAQYVDTLTEFVQISDIQPDFHTNMTYEKPIDILNKILEGLPIYIIHKKSIVLSIRHVVNCVLPQSKEPTNAPDISGILEVLATSGFRYHENTWYLDERRITYRRTTNHDYDDLKSFVENNQSIFERITKQ
jgi:hypothetical protein